MATRMVLRARGLLLTGLLVLGGCAARSEPAGRAPDLHDSRSSLDWAGTYEGVLPCADCPGIETRLELRSDGGFELTTRYQDRQPAPQTTRGRFEWDGDGNSITLGATGQRFRVGEGRLLQLGRDGSVPSWNDSHRVLSRVPR